MVEVVDAVAAGVVDNGLLFVSRSVLGTVDAFRVSTVDSALIDGLPLLWLRAVRFFSLL